MTSCKKNAVTLRTCESRDRTVESLSPHHDVEGWLEVVGPALQVLVRECQTDEIPGAHDDGGHGADVEAEQRSVPGVMCTQRWNGDPCARRLSLPTSSWMITLLSTSVVHKYTRVQRWWRACFSGFKTGSLKIMSWRWQVMITMLRRVQSCFRDDYLSCHWHVRRQWSHRHWCSTGLAFHHLSLDNDWTSLGVYTSRREKYKQLEFHFRFVHVIYLSLRLLATLHKACLSFPYWDKTWNQFGVNCIYLIENVADHAKNIIRGESKSIWIGSRGWGCLLWRTYVVQLPQLDWRLPWMWCRSICMRNV